MLEGFSESAPRQGIQGWRTRASSKSCDFPAHQPIFRPFRARAGAAPHRPAAANFSRERGDHWSAPGAASGAKRAPRSYGRSRTVVPAPRHRGRLIGSGGGGNGAGRALAIGRPLTRRAAACASVVVSARFSASRLGCLLNSDLFKELSAATCRASRRASGWNAKRVLKFGSGPRGARRSRWEAGGRAVLAWPSSLLPQHQQLSFH